jgi:hypothetical protein
VPCLLFVGGLFFRSPLIPTTYVPKIHPHVIISRSSKWMVLKTRAMYINLLSKFILAVYTLIH